MVQTTVTRETRFFLWLVVAVIGPFGLLLCLYPGGANSYWAWEMGQSRTAVMVGAIYFASGFYYLLLLRQRDWTALQTSLRSLFVVAAWLLVAAMFHWESFFPYRILTLMWLGAYYLPLLALPILFRLQAERFPGARDTEGARIGTGWRAWLVARAVVYGAAAILLFVVAPMAVGAWPWPIEPLNVRIFSGQLAVFGAFPALALRRGTMDGLRLLLMLAAAVATIQIIGIIFNGSFYNWSAPAGMLLPLMFIEWLATSLAMVLRYRR